MRRRVVGANRLVVAAPDDLAVQDHHRAYRHFASLSRLLRQPERLTHQLFVGRLGQLHARSCGLASEDGGPSSHEPPPRTTARLHPPAIRLATPDDAPAIARVHVIAWQQTYAGILPAAFLDQLVG